MCALTKRKVQAIKQTNRIRNHEKEKKEVNGEKNMYTKYC